MKSTEYTKHASEPDSARPAGHFQPVRKSAHFCKKTHFFGEQNTRSQTWRGLRRYSLRKISLFLAETPQANRPAGRTSKGIAGNHRIKTHKTGAKTPQMHVFGLQKRGFLCTTYSHCPHH
ncbi:hypothetical protein ACV50R_002592 [Salmonella enterica subsp. enterica serovar Newport]